MGSGGGGEGGDCSVLCYNNGDAYIDTLKLSLGWTTEVYNCSNPMKIIQNPSKWEFQTCMLNLPL